DAGRLDLYEDLSGSWPFEIEGGDFERFARVVRDCGFDFHFLVSSRGSASRLKVARSKLRAPWTGREPVLLFQARLANHSRRPIAASATARPPSSFNVSKYTTSAPSAGSRARILSVSACGIGTIALNLPTTRATRRGSPPA